MNFKKTAALCIAAAAAIAVAGCGTSTRTGKVSKDGKVSISIGNWPYETETNFLEKYNGYKETMEEKYPDITIVPDTYHYDTKTFTMKAGANQLPTMFSTYFTEVGKVTKAGYAADITDVVERYGLTKEINPDLLKLVTDENGRIRALPLGAYAQGLLINKALFKQAGLVNSDGSIKIPDTYEEMAEFAGIIREKTGKSGYLIPTTNNCGGWHFMNIAWSNGVEFMKQNSDGKWEAVFNSPEAIKSLQYIKDLKWKYNAMTSNSLVDLDELYKQFGTGQVAMIFASGASDVTKKYDIPLSDVVMAKMPAGTAGRYAQMGGEVRMFAPSAMPEQLDACMKWLELIGFKAKLDDVAISVMKDNLQRSVDQKAVVLGKTALPVWVDAERIALEAEVSAPYINVDLKDYESYLGFEGVTLKSEEPVACQQLYAVLDGCIQEVVTNANADPAALIKKACEDFQLNHLDKE